MRAISLRFLTQLLPAGRKIVRSCSRCDGTCDAKPDDANHGEDEMRPSTLTLLLLSAMGLQAFSGQTAAGSRTRRSAMPSSAGSGAVFPTSSPD